MSSDGEKESPTRKWGLGRFLAKSNNHTDSDEENGTRRKAPLWSMGILNDKDTVEVPGSVLLLATDRNEPLGLRNIHARTSHSSIPAGFIVEGPITPGGTRPGIHTPTLQPPEPEPPSQPEEEKKRTEDGTIILEPQPEESANDPLNWPSWRRDSALLSLGFYCMLGGGMTPLIAAGFTDVAHEYNVEVESVALTTGLYMMGLGMGSVIASPTAILFGKRPVYLASAILFIVTSVWAGLSPSFNSLLAARVFQGVAISPVECLPSATIAEIFFLHERAYRIGIYTLLLLGGKNLVPLVSAAIIGRFGWRWTFYIVAMIVGLAGVLLFFFVPETFWDRTPTRKPSRPNFLRRLSSRYSHKVHVPHVSRTPNAARPHSPGAADRNQSMHVGFASGSGRGSVDLGPASPSSAYQRNLHVGFTDVSSSDNQSGTDASHSQSTAHHSGSHATSQLTPLPEQEAVIPTVQVSHDGSELERPRSVSSHIQSPHSPRHVMCANNQHLDTPGHGQDSIGSPNSDYFSHSANFTGEKLSKSQFTMPPKVQAYTHNLRQQPAQSFVQQLKLYNGRLNKDKWYKVMVRPFILFAYPAVLWSSVVYACSIGWLIVISETMAMIYRDPTLYNFDALQTGLVYLSPFIGGILGTGVAGKISDVIVKAMARRNGGLYEPEFRLVMAIPILITTCIGLMGFGWSAEQHDHWMVPTIFFGIVSFGCSLGSTTSITFCVDSYRQYAGEALVTLNFSKNVIHGLVFSLFVSHWLKSDGPKMVYIWIGVIQLILLLFTLPLYIYGKRLRMWTVRKNLMEKF